jgi:hypothetical protein
MAGRRAADRMGMRVGMRPPAIVPGWGSPCIQRVGHSRHRLSAFHYDIPDISRNSARHFRLRLIKGSKAIFALG